MQRRNAELDLYAVAEVARQPLLTAIVLANVVLPAYALDPRSAS